MIESVRQLGAGAPLKSVAHRAGYQSVSAFAYAFRLQFGVSPGQYFSRSSDHL
jgi:AraC-like DNA-binding protein